MPHNSVRRTAVVAAVVLAGMASAQTADAVSANDTTPTISVGDTDIDIYGPAGDLDVTVTDPPAADAYVTLELAGGGNLSQLDITDDAGTRRTPSRKATAKKSPPPSTTSASSAAGICTSRPSNPNASIANTTLRCMTDCTLKECGSPDPLTTVGGPGGPLSFGKCNLSCTPTLLFFGNYILSLQMAK